MDKIVLKGSELDSFYHDLGVERPADVYLLRISTDGDSLKWKVNEGIWSPPMGEFEPAT